MSALHVSYDNMSVTAMRPENPTKSFASSDVPHGTDSVYIKAAKILVHSHGKVLTVGIPKFEQSDIDTKIATKKNALSDVSSYTDSEEENKNILDRTEILIPSSGEVQDKINKERGFTDIEAQQKCDIYNHTPTNDDPQNPTYPDPQRTLDQQKELMCKKNSDGSTATDLSTGDASTIIINTRKQEIAETQVVTIIDQCLEVPTISQNFKDQFTTTETE